MLRGSFASEELQYAYQVVCNANHYFYTSETTPIGTKYVTSYGTKDYLNTERSVPCLGKNYAHTDAGESNWHYCPECGRSAWSSLTSGVDWYYTSVKKTNYLNGVLPIRLTTKLPLDTTITATKTTQFGTNAGWTVI